MGLVPFPLSINGPVYNAFDVSFDHRLTNLLKNILALVVFYYVYYPSSRLAAIELTGVGESTIFSELFSLTFVLYAFYDS